MTFLCHFFFFFSSRAVASVVPYLLTPSSWWRLCGPVLLWIEITLTLTAALQAHATVFFFLFFFIPPSGKITITLEWNINHVVEKEKDGQSWGVQAGGGEEEIRDNVLFLDRCCSQIAADGGERVYLLTIEYVGNGSLKMTDGQAWMKIFVFVR